MAVSFHSEKTDVVRAIHEGKTPLPMCVLNVCTAGDVCYYSFATDFGW